MHYWLDVNDDESTVSNDVKVGMVDYYALVLVCHLCVYMIT